MTATRDHPAVTTSRRAVATGAVLAAPTVVAQAAKAAAGGGRQPNALEQALRSLYPGGDMDNVQVKKWSSNPNPLIRVGSKGLFAAWTNSATLVYYNDTLVSRAGMTFARDYFLRHESIHVLQFARQGRPPLTFTDMLGAELQAYPETEAWVKDAKGGGSRWPAQAQLDKVRALAAGASAGVLSTAQVARSRVTVNPQGMPADEVYLRAVIEDDGLPPFRTVREGEQEKELVYTVRDLYEQDARTSKARWKALGY